MSTDLLDRDTHASSDLRHMDDMLLRAAGFRIHSRPAGGPPLWTRAGRVYAQATAVRLACEEGERSKKE